jgi:hypothetical protein
MVFLIAHLRECIFIFLRINGNEFFPDISTLRFKNTNTIAGTSALSLICHQQVKQCIRMIEQPAACQENI